MGTEKDTQSGYEVLTVVKIVDSETVPKYKLTLRLDYL